MPDKKGAVQIVPPQAVLNHPLGIPIRKPFVFRDVQGNDLAPSLLF